MRPGRIGSGEERAPASQSFEPGASPPVRPPQHAPAAQVVAGDVDELVGPSGRVSVDAGPSRPPRSRPSQASGKRTASRSGTGTAISGPDVAPDGAGARIPGRLEVLTGADRTRAFTLSRGGLAVAG